MSAEHRFSFLRDNWYRDVWALMLTIIVVWASVGTYHNQQDQKVGRRVSLGATCAAVSGVIEAGRATILAGVTIKPDRFERNLEHIGLPPARLRKEAAADAAAAYSRAIAVRVAQATHNASLVRKDGTLDCARLKIAAHLTGNP